MKRSLSRNEKDEIIRRLAAELKCIPTCRFAYLYGSFLTGDFNDIDVAAYYSEKPDVRELIRTENKLSEKIGLPVDLQTLNRAPLAFAHQVIKTGSPIFACLDEERSDYEEKIRDLYFDFRPFLNRYLHEAVNDH